MAPISQSDSGALEHILSSIILMELPPSTADSVTIPPFRACFSKADVSNASDFISMEPNAYGSISFGITSPGDEDQQLSIIQKVNKSTPSSLGITKSPMLSCWPNLDNTYFQVWHTLPSTAHSGALLLPPTGLSRPSSTIYDFRKSVKYSISDYNDFKEECLCWHSWHRHLLTTAARGHNADNVLSLTFVS
jgi:hypothetical protein